VKNIITYFFFTIIPIYIFSDAVEPIKIAIIGCHDPKYDHIGIYSHLSKSAYATKNGYDFHLYTEYLLDVSRKGYWYKLIAAQKNLPYYDWLFYLDSDAVIMNHSIRLESLIDDNYDMIAAGTNCEGFPVLSGQFLIKNSEWSKKFLDEWFEVGDTNIQPGYDGGALIKLYNERPDVRDHIKLIPLVNMGSYDWDYKEGDFVIQFAGYIFPEKEKRMIRYYNLSLLQNNQ